MQLEKKESVEIRFIDICKVSFDDQNYLCEVFLQGDYRKFNSNQFLINTESNQTDQILNDFSIWTLSETGEKLMVVDLQGVKKTSNGKTVYYLTDPAINSIQKIFGSTDMGKTGIMGCLYTYSLTKKDLKGKNKSV